MLRSAMAVVASTASVLALTAGPAEATPVIKVAQVYYNSPGTDTRSNYSLNGEYVVLKNTTSTARYLTGWTVTDASSHVYKFGTYKLGAYASVRVHTGSGTNTATNRYQGRAAYVWNNDTDTAYLRNPAGTLIHKCYYNNALVAYHNC